MRIQEILKESGDEELDWIQSSLNATGSYVGWQKSKYGWSYAGYVGVTNLSSLPIKLHRVHNFSINVSFISSLENFPDEVDDRFAISHCNNLTDLSDLPKCKNISIAECGKLTKLSELLQHLKGPVNYLDIKDTPITDLTGLATVKYPIKEIKLKNLKVERGLLGLLLIPGLEELDTHWITMGDFELLDATSIINNYVGKPDLIYECQAKLIDEGLERFAEI